VTRGFFVTGTDTGVGKTVVACALVRGLRERGLDVGVMKPSETGVDERGPLDAQALREAAEVADPLDLVCPQQLALPAAPSVAAAAAGREVDLVAIRSAWMELCRRHPWMVVEGAGGLLVPLARGLDMAGLAAELGLRVLVVARAALGTYNHTLLTLEALRQRGLTLAGVVVSHTTGLLGEAETRNLAALREALGSDLCGEVPLLAPGEQPGPEALDLERLLA